MKIDGAFIRDIADNRLDREIVQSIVRVNKAMRVETIAEFVEDKRTMALLGGLGVDYGQGYGIHKPVPIEVEVSSQINFSV